MKFLGKKTLCALMATLCFMAVFAGCKKGVITAGNSTAGSSTSQPIGPADYKIPEDTPSWKANFFKVATDNIIADNGAELWLMEVFMPDSSSPFMVLTYGRGDEYPPYVEIWKHAEDGTISRIHAGKTLVSGVLISTVNPVFATERKDGEKALTLLSELSGKTMKPLVEIGYKDESKNFYSSMRSEEKWTVPEWRMQNPIPMGDAADFLQMQSDIHRLSDAQKVDKLADYFLGAYKVNVPEGTPAWIGAYIARIRSHQMFPYGDRDTGTASWKSLVIREVFGKESPPVLSEIPWYDFGGTFAGLYYKTSHPSTLLDGPRTSYDFWQDGDGKSLITHNYHLSQDWFSASTNMQYMFSLGEFDDGISGYCDAVMNDFPSEAALASWQARQRDSALQKRGFKSPLTEMDKTMLTLALGDEAVTWAQLEKALLDALIKYNNDTK